MRTPSPGQCQSRYRQTQSAKREEQQLRDSACFSVLRYKKMISSPILETTSLTTFFQCIHIQCNNQKVLILHSTVGEGTGKWLLLACWLECKWFPLFKLTTCIHADCNILTLEEFSQHCVQKKKKYKQFYCSLFVRACGGLELEEEVNAGFKGTHP